MLQRSARFLLQGGIMNVELHQPVEKPLLRSPSSFITGGALCGGIGLLNEALSQRLTRETSLLQAELDSLLLLLARPATEQRYRAFCGALWGFYAPLEQRLRGVGGLVQTLGEQPQRSRTELLELDLAEMGMNVPELELLACKKLPALADEAHALGACHVLEACALGHRHLQRYLSHMLPSLSERASHFLSCYGERTEERWAAFAGQLSAAAEREERPIDPEAAIEGALETLLAARQWFQAALGEHAIGAPRTAVRNESKRSARLGWSEIERAVLRAWPQLGLSPWSQPERKATPVAPWGRIELRQAPEHLDH
jgi:heme oxygenase